MKIRAMADRVKCSEALLQRLLRQKKIAGRKSYSQAYPRGVWEITSPVHQVRRVVQRLLSAEQVVFARVRYRLTDEECWGQAAPSYMAEGAARGATSYVVSDARYSCPYCHSLDLTWNGREYYCDRCNPTVPIIPDAEITRVYSGAGFPSPAGWLSVGSNDGYYSQETALYRVPASSNWARARNDPKLDRTREEIPGRSKSRRGDSLRVSRRRPVGSF